MKATGIERVKLLRAVGFSIRQKENGVVRVEAPGPGWNRDVIETLREVKSEIESAFSAGLL